MKSDEVVNAILKMSRQVDTLNSWHEAVNKWMERTDKKSDDMREELITLRNDVMWILRIIFGVGSLGLLFQLYVKLFGG